MPPSCLILDDSRLVRAVARALFESLGFDVCEAEDVRDGLMQCAANAPDLVLVDWNMPDADGISFIRAVRADPALRQPKLLLCSTETRLSAIRSALRAGADSYLLKPFNRDRLEHRLHRFGFR
jgi:two-component system, chemotaxis family, chemotaxis protein CheY